MYFPYLRGRQFELIALRELLENDRMSEKIIPIIEPINPSSTLLKTLKCFIEKERKIAIIYNPEVGEFFDKLEENEKGGSKVAKEIKRLLNTENGIIQSYIMESDKAEELKSDEHKIEYLMINKTRDDLDSFLEIYDNDEEPEFTLIPDNRAFRRIVRNSRVLFEDKFKKRTRNVDYIGHEDEFFSEDHLYFEVEEGDLKSEYLLPNIVDKLLKEERANVKVLETQDRWFGVTYKEDKETVQEAFKELISDGVYAEKLWE